MATDVSDPEAAPALTEADQSSEAPMSIASFEEVYRRTHRDLVRLAGLLTGDGETAADAVADAFADFFRVQHRVDIDDPSAYLRRSVVNRIIGRRRRDGTRKRYRHRVARAGSVADRSDNVDERLVLWRALQTLPARQRAVLVLRFYEDWSVEAVAECLGLRSGTVKSATSRGLDTLRATLGEEIEDG